MKKFIVLSFFVCSFFNVYSADWDLFPLNQRSYFYNPSGWYKNVELNVMDSTKATGQESILYFRRNLKLNGAANCYEDTLQELAWNNNYENIDSLVQRNDTVFYYSGFNSPFFFLPNAAIGQSWIINITSSNNDPIIITCDTIMVETFLGVTDSVKIFSMQNSNNPSINNFIIRLSKNHGLLEYVPFRSFFYYPYQFDSLILIGFDSAGVEYGYKQPKFKDYFHLSAGDILLWSHYIDWDDWTFPDQSAYYRDSITNSVITEDSVIYTYNRTTRNSSLNITSQENALVTKFFRKGFENIIETPPRWLGFGNNHFADAFWDSTVSIWNSDYIELSVDAISQDTITSYSFFNGGVVVDTNDCTINGMADVGYSFDINTKKGVTQYCNNNFNSNCVSLIASKISNVVEGIINISVYENASLKYDNSLKVFPNPAAQTIGFQNIFSTEAMKYEIFNVLGQLAKQGEFNNKPIEIESLSNGLYFIQIKTNTQSLSGKFIKQ